MVAFGHCAQLGERGLDVGIGIAAGLDSSALMTSIAAVTPST
jgi:hypothetical protein